jgi:carbonic anhydrase/acetyltransferase-like protein (isoleucine patch superfamily)
MTPCILPVNGIHPRYDSTCWLAPNCTLVGDVELGEESTVWFGAIVRGDVAPIRIGKRVNIQDGAVVHGTFEKSQTEIEDGASIGHLAIVHGAHIGAGALIGMGAVILDHAEVGEGAVVAAGAVVLAGTQIPPRTLWAGVPAVQRGEARPELLDQLAQTAQRYVTYSRWFASEK